MAGKNLFNSVKMTRPNRNVFDLTHDVKLSCNMGELIPTLCMECVPGDSFDIGCDSFSRLAPMVFPLMHRIDVTMHYFFVPNRLVWPNWETYITNATPGSLPAFPTIIIGAGGSGSYTRLMDYMGLPNPAQSTGSSNHVVSAIPFAAYNKIYNEYYRDQNLITAVVDELVDGDNAANKAALTAIRLRAWEHDYFTASLPFAQKGSGVSLPIGGFADVPVYNNASGTSTTITASQTLSVDNEISATMAGDQLYANTSDLALTSTTINDLRRAFRLQEWLEKAARGGSRYVENILAHFGVRSSDARLQRPEYITGTKSPVVVSEVLQTGVAQEGGDDSPVGTMKGHGISVTQGRYGKYFCEEHGYVIGIMSIMPKTAYQQGIPKHFGKINDPFEFFWPSFAHLGEQEVKRAEVFAYTTNGAQVFGYVPRYAEYKFMPNRVAGEFRTTMNGYHLGRIFATEPSLNQEFVECVPANSRVFAAGGVAFTEYVWTQILHKIRAVRPMPVFGTPSFG